MLQSQVLHPHLRNHLRSVVGDDNKQPSEHLPTFRLTAGRLLCSTDLSAARTLQQIRRGTCPSERPSRTSEKH